MIRIAILDDWQDAARRYADWGKLRGRAELRFFQQPIPAEEAAETLAGFEVLLTVQDRTKLPASLIDRLPCLRMIGTTVSNASLDMDACRRRGIIVCRTDQANETGAWAPVELALGLMISSFRGLEEAGAAMRDGGFQTGVPIGRSIAGRTLGIVGLGRLGARLAAYSSALGMDVVAWSPRLTAEEAAAKGARAVTKEALLEISDVVSIHVKLSDGSRGLIGAADLARMKRGALLVNTSRGPIVDEAALVDALRREAIKAALDVFDEEPLPADHPLRRLPGATLTPHLGFGVEEAWRVFYPQSLENVLAYMDGRPIRVVGADR